MPEKRGRPPKPRCIVPDELCRAYAAGTETGVSIAARLGVPVSTVYLSLRRQGVPLRGRGGKGLPHLADRKPVPDALLDAVLAGRLTLSQAARQARCSLSTFRHRLLEARPAYREHLDRRKTLLREQWAERRRQIVARWKSGRSLEQVAREFKLSRERVRQIVTAGVGSLPHYMALTLCRWCGGECAVKGGGHREVWCPACWAKKKGG